LHALSQWKTSFWWPGMADWECNSVTTTSKFFSFCLIFSLSTNLVLLYSRYLYCT
jgi:hypothetical protein